MDDKTLPQNFPQDVAYVRPLKYWVQMVLPLVYDDSLSYYELLNKVVMKLNELVKTCNELAYIYNHIDEYIDQKIDGIEVSLMEKLKQYIDEILPPMLEDFVTKQELQEEATTREQADQTLQTNINEEATKRADADNALRGNISTEAQTRKQDDDALRALITQETTNRTNADTNLQNQINQINSDFREAITTEENARQSADTALQGQINAINSGLNDFATKTALNQEIAEREAGDNALRALIESKGGGEYTNEKAQFAVRCVQSERATDFVAVSEKEFYVKGPGATPVVYHYTETEKTQVGSYGITGLFKATKGVYGWKTETDGLHVVKIDSTAQTTTIPGFPMIDAVSDVAYDGYVYACYHNGVGLNVYRIKGDFTGAVEEVGAYTVNEFESTSITEFSWIAGDDSETENTKRYFSVFSPDLGLAVYDASANGLLKWIACPDVVDYLEQGSTVSAKCTSINSGMFLTHNDIRGAYNYFSIVNYDLIKGVTSQIEQKATYSYDTEYSLIPKSASSHILRVCVQLATTTVNATNNIPDEANRATHISKSLAINNLQYAGIIYADAPCRFSNCSINTTLYAYASCYFSSSNGVSSISNMYAYAPVKVIEYTIGTLYAEQGSVFKNCTITSIGQESFGIFVNCTSENNESRNIETAVNCQASVTDGVLSIQIPNIAKYWANSTAIATMYFTGGKINYNGIEYGMPNFTVNTLNSRGTSVELFNITNTTFETALVLRCYPQTNETFGANIFDLLNKSKIEITESPSCYIYVRQIKKPTN